MPTATTDVSLLTINTIRTLAMDAVQRANSGHPGTPMALAPVMYALWHDVLRYDPTDPLWPARDRFVLSCGHASMLLYATLHLAGVRAVDSEGRATDRASITLDDLRNFRQLGSPCAGHPEHGHAAGIETTTGPLGQGLGNSVGMAIAQQWLSARFDRPGYKLFDYRVYALCSDGDLMEGVGSEAASLAGHLKLGNLCWLYDDNHITIEGETSLAFSENVAERFAGYGWNVLRVADANDLPALAAALRQAVGADDRPTLIIVRSIIGWGAPNVANTHKAHGAPLGEAEITLTKKAYGWPDEKFLAPAEAAESFRAALAARGGAARRAWDKQWEAYEREYPQLAAEYRLMRERRLPEGWDADLPTFPTDAKGLATRVSGGKVLAAIAGRVPWLLGGSADLAPSTMTLLPNEKSFSAACREGRNFHFGIREHAMAAACNGLALSDLRPFGATFFVFTDYMRPSMRLAAIMELPVVFVCTHDSLGVGEDGPTHQPIEHLASLRAMPGMLVVRPGDANEAAEAWRAVMREGRRPATLVLSRQDVPTVDRQRYAPAAGAARGGYVVADPPGGSPEVILIGTGSELSLCLAAHEALLDEGRRPRVVSLPCWEWFDEQPADYRESVLPRAVTARVGVELGVEQGWERYLGPQGRFVGLRSYGASAPYKTLLQHFGITPEHVVAEAKAALGLAER